MSDASMCFIEIWGREKRERVPGGERVSWQAEYYTFKRSAEDGSVRDDRHADEIVKSLLGRGAMWRNEEPTPTATFKPWFTVIIGVLGTRKSKSRYTIDYAKHQGAPLEIIDQGMWIFKTIKRNIKSAVKKGEAR